MRGGFPGCQDDDVKPGILGQATDAPMNVSICGCANNQSFQQLHGFHVKFLTFDLVALSSFHRMS